MNPSYFRIKLDKADALERLSIWLDTEINHVIETSLDLVVDESLVDGAWKGPSLYFYSNKNWTVFEDISGHYGAISAKKWQEFAGKDEFVFAGYNDAIGYGEFIRIENGVIRNEFFADTTSPEDNVSINNDSSIMLSSWIDVAGIVDDDELFYADSGWLWINE